MTEGAAVYTGSLADNWYNGVELDAVVQHGRVYRSAPPSHFDSMETT